MADVNNDGRADLIVADSVSIVISLGHGDGTFTFAPGSPIPEEQGANFVATGDFNGDGRVDIVEVQQGGGLATGSIGILLGNGDGSFRSAPGSPIPVPNFPRYATIADLNDDHVPDIAVASQYGGLTVFLGKGDGTFIAGPPSPVLAGGHAWALAAADFNGDHIPDLAVTEPGISSSLAILLGNGDGSFRIAPGSPIGTGMDTVSIAVGDLNGDRNPDIAVMNYGNGERASNVSILLGRGDGTFIEASGSPVGLGGDPHYPALAEYVALADVNSDQKLDLIVPSLSNPSAQIGSVLIFLGNGDGTFIENSSSYGVGRYPGFAVVGDLNNDAKADIVTANINGCDSDGCISILLNTTLFPGTDRSPPTVTYSAHPAAYGVDQQVGITCTATDPAPGSGLASTTCKDITGPAYSFPLGLNRFSATATDNAGNIGSGTTSFTVTVDVASLSNLVNQFVTNKGIANSLRTKIEKGNVGPFINEVNGQTGKALTSVQAAILIKLANGL